MVKINGEALAVAGKTLAEYLAGTDYNPKRIAVERNGEIVPKAAYGEPCHAGRSDQIFRM